jgi:hypothetical protein
MRRLFDYESRDGCSSARNNGCGGRDTYRTLLGATVRHEDVSGRAIARATERVDKQQPKDYKIS